MLTKIKNFFYLRWPLLREILVALFLVIFAAVLFYGCGTKKPAPEVVEVPAITQEAVKEAIPEVSDKEAARIERVIVREKETRVPDQRWYADSQAASDKKAQELAKKDKADKLIKTSEEKVVESTKEGEGSQKVIENDYYAINLERKHEIKVGAAVIDSEPYGTVAYRNRDIEYTAYVGDHKYGASVQYTIAKW